MTVSPSPSPEEVELELRLARFEQLMARRPLLLNSVLLRQNPHNVHEWHKRVQLYQGRPEQVGTPPGGGQRVAGECWIEGEGDMEGRRGTPGDTRMRTGDTWGWWEGLLRDTWGQQGVCGGTCGDSEVCIGETREWLWWGTPVCV